MLKPVFYFLCTGNSCRSQMAEGWARHFCKDRIEVYSAGVETHGLNPRAVAVMKESDVDITHHNSKLIDPELLSCADYVITLCGDANDKCPMTPPHVKRLHWGFEDPAKAQGTDDEIQTKFREVRDDIRDKVHGFLTQIGLLTLNTEGRLFTLNNLTKDQIRQNVRSRYKQIAVNVDCCSTTAGCCNSPVDYNEISAKLGYSNKELSAVPSGANLGLGCGNPQAIAELKLKEVVLDLGSGGGFDCCI